MTSSVPPEPEPTVEDTCSAISRHTIMWAINIFEAVKVFEVIHIIEVIQVIEAMYTIEAIDMAMARGGS